MSLNFYFPNIVGGCHRAAFLKIGVLYIEQVRENHFVNVPNISRKKEWSLVKIQYKLND